jgi:hypothetical protein
MCISICVCVCSGCITMHHFWWNFPEVSVQQRSKTPLRSATPQAPAALCSGPLFWQVQDLRRCLRSTTTRKIATAQQYTYESIQICICIYMYRIYTCVYIYMHVWFFSGSIYTYMYDTNVPDRHTCMILILLPCVYIYVAYAIDIWYVGKIQIYLCMSIFIYIYM